MSNPLPNLCDVRTIVHDGRVRWLFPDGSTLPIVAGGDGTGDPPTPPPAPPAPPTPPPTPSPAPPAGYVTQEELNRVAAAEKAQGARKAETDLLASLGVTDAAEAKKILDAHREAERSAMSEADKAKADAAADRALAATEKAQAAADRRDAAVERALVRGGITLPEDEAAAANALARAVRLVDIDGDVTPEKVTAAVAELKVDMPALFQAPAGNGNGGMPNGNPGGRHQGPPGQPTGIEAGRLRAQREAEAKKAIGTPLDNMSVMGR